MTILTWNDYYPIEGREEYMNSDQEKAVKFVSHLWDNPSLSGFIPLQKEEQIHQFLDVNAGMLRSTMASPTYFPNIQWNEVRSLLGKIISDLTNRELLPLCESILNKRIDFAFIHRLSRQSISPMSVKDQLGQLMKTLLDKPESRWEMIGPVIAVESGIVDKYMKCVFDMPKHINFELIKVQRLTLSPEEITNLLKITMLIRPSMKFFITENQLLISPVFARQAVMKITGIFNIIPEEIIKAAINSFLSFLDNPKMEGTSRLASVLAHRCRHLKHGMRVDRGAVSSDKSWFSIARKNYKIYGFDLDMLVELHLIASEQGW